MNFDILMYKDIVFMIITPQMYINRLSSEARVARGEGGGGGEHIIISLSADSCQNAPKLIIVNGLETSACKPNTLFGQTRV